jgi:hypothetical protein
MSVDWISGIIIGDAQRDVIELYLQCAGVGLLYTVYMIINVTFLPNKNNKLYHLKFQLAVFYFNI